MEEPMAIGPHVDAGHSAEIHLPPPSYWPPILAIGISAAIAGLAMRPWVWIGGLVICVIALSGWLRELGRDIVEAPTEPEF
jgi:cytochrome c oxidase subunit IV